MLFKRKGSPVVSIPAPTLCRIRELAVVSRHVETGGILVGRNDGKDIEVTGASDAGPNATQTATHFLRDTPHCEDFLATAFQTDGSDYIGEWHTHVVSLHKLSLGDLGTLAGILFDSDYDFMSFATVLVLVNDKEVQLQVYVAEKASSGNARKEIIVTQLYRGKFPDSSP
jgi:integrative and conjugative element protein (TIGR02256 family)